MLPRPRPRLLPFLLSNTHTHTRTQNATAAIKSFFFSTTSRSRAQEPTYYEILNVPITASTSEIKKKFYSLSLKHHPDRNRSDPNASSRFATISSAYQVLSDSGKRAVYDRDHGIHSSAYAQSTGYAQHQHQHPHTPRGSHSSYQAGGSYAGSRPASGLSKRRGAFRGPPPSFYAHGGYGANRPRPGARGGRGRTAGGKEEYANYVDEEDPTAFIDRNPVGHFNARGHYRTQTREDVRRGERRRRAMGEAIREQEIGGAGDVIVRFLVVCGILAGTLVIPGLFWGESSSSKGGKKEKEKV